MGRQGGRGPHRRPTAAAAAHRRRLRQQTDGACASRPRFSPLPSAFRGPKPCLVPALVPQAQLSPPAGWVPPALTPDHPPSPRCCPALPRRRRRLYEGLFWLGLPLLLGVAIGWAMPTSQRCPVVPNPVARLSSIIGWVSAAWPVSVPAAATTAATFAGTSPGRQMALDARLGLGAAWLVWALKHHV